MYRNRNPDGKCLNRDSEELPKAFKVPFSNSNEIPVEEKDSGQWTSWGFGHKSGLLNGLSLKFVSGQSYVKLSEVCRVSKFKGSFITVG